ncbi:predicted protein [Sclerotinia sclerotiorum 1980 UF-70]|uniref:Uncharacterized protein n=1 Tax=Sclerotinia sclerotiorum (strain ATCC 18683 / 1980 / Ss-1) TaxID=665079 RepID=A7F8N9_SCLS1|nr:predicted protein [Sclerotinia sclerotiorum 1980 UF-70]EDN99110.1 predicted protein [Sclerotinia sclerotiorum 1980 UF-70]
MAPAFLIYDCEEQNVKRTRQIIALVSHTPDSPVPSRSYFISLHFIPIKTYN